MKLVKTLLFVLLPTLLLAQGFPVRSQVEDFQSRLFSEGMPIYAVYRSSNSSWTTSTSFYSGAPTPGTAWFVENVSISADTALSASIQFSYVNIVPSGKVSPLWTVAFPKTGGAQNFALNRFIYEGTAINATAQAAGGKSTSWVRGGVIATKVSADFGKKVDKKIMLVMDSIGDGINTDAAGEETYPFLLNDSLQVATGKSWGKINKCLSGATSTDMENARIKHHLEPSQVDMIYYAMGMNDTDASVYLTNLTKFIKWKKRTWPNAVLLVGGPTPGVDATKEGVLATIRTNAQTLVATQSASDKIFYVNLGTAWNYATQQNTYTTDGTHPNILGHALIYARVRTALTSTLLNYLK